METVVAFRADEKLLKKIDRRAKLERRSRANFIRALLTEVLGRPHVEVHFTGSDFTPSELRAVLERQEDVK